MDFIHHHNQLLLEAEASLKRIQAELIDLSLDDEDEGSGGDSEMNTLRTLQLVLQFRLDMQDALQLLFQFSQSLFQILGLSPLHSRELNMERLGFALGGADLHHALSMLSRLIDALLRIVQRYHLGPSIQNRANLNRQKTMERLAYTPPPLQLKMIKLVSLQQSYNLILEQLRNSLEDAIEGQPVLGPLYEHITKLQGPISRFTQAMRHGLIAVGGLSQQLETSCQMNKKLDELLLKANQVLTLAPQLIETPRLFKPNKIISTTQALESRASEKRLGCFFSHP